MSVCAADLLQRFCADGTCPVSAPKTVVVAAHPDDEVVGAGARLPRLQDALFVHVTDGSPHDLSDARSHGFETREAYARARRCELEAALALAGIAPDQALELGCVDQEAALRMADLSRCLADLFHDLQPDAVLTHPYEGGHPDHDATAFAVHAACRLLEREGGTPPALLEMTSYHNGPAGIVTYEFLPYDGCDPVTLPLSDGERAFKRRLFDCYATQRETLGYFPIGIERFRIAPRYDFAQYPAWSPLFYEGFNWGMTGERFCGLAGDAMDALEIGGPL
ncbi:MAG: PIG-L family deacetylase [Armatimonadetes bacterium]|nr:PIG-L family deacetylase [Armatimonadota bacterium]